MIVGVVIISLVALKKNPTNNVTNSSNDGLFSEKNLVTDTYLTDDYENDALYKNTIRVPKYMTRMSGINNTIASYVYKNKQYSLSLEYDSYLTDSSLKKDYILDDQFKKEENYYLSKSDNAVKIYFKNSNNIYQTITIKLYSEIDGEYSIDESYKNLLKNLSSVSVDKSEYSISSKNGYFKDNIVYNSYEDEDNKYTVKIDYSVSSEKYGSIYNKDSKYQEVYKDKSSISFYEGEITTALSSVKARTMIQMYLTKITNLDLNEELENDLEWPINQTAFEDVKKEDVKFDISSFKYNDKVVNYYKVTSDNNGAHGERIYAYLNIKDNLYYIIQIIGGENKNIDVSVIKDFLPTNIVIE